MLAGYVPTDVLYEDESYPGHDAEVGIYYGPPDRVGIMESIGWHKKRLAMLAPNSTWLPEKLLEHMEKSITGYIVPSSWARDVLSRYTKLPIYLWRHGVDEGFCTDREDRAALLRDYDHGRFVVGHLASSTMQRKGTRELLAAWCGAVSMGLFGRAIPMLKLVVDGPEGFFDDTIEETSSGNPRIKETIVWSRRRWNMDVGQAAHFYRKHHLICQPSRGEGFGLVPLEARACGVQVLATDCTGHSEHVRRLRPDGVSISSGSTTISNDDLGPIDDGPGAVAPGVTAHCIMIGLMCAYSAWPVVARDMEHYANTVREAWSWKEVTRLWLDDAREIFK